MDREPPAVTVSAPDPGGRPPDVLEGAPGSPRRRWPTAVLLVVALVALGAAVVRGGPSPAPPEARPQARPAPLASEAAGTAGITATASLGGAPTDDEQTQRLTFTVDLPALDAAAGRMLGDEAALVDVRVRGFSVRPDDAREVLPLGRFGVASRGRSTTVPATVVVDDCFLESEARRDIVLVVRTGAGPDGTVRVAADADVVGALDGLFRRTCRRWRG